MFIKKSISSVLPVLFSAMVTLAVLIGSAAFPTNVRAFAITVATSADELNTNGLCSLREAITNANNDAATYPDCGMGGGNDGIFFSDSLGTASIILGSALPTISDTDGLTIWGGDDITVSGNNSSRVFAVGSGAPLTLDSLTVVNGKVTSGVGGGIFNAAGTLTLTNCLLTGNSAVDGVGGGIYSTGGTLTITDSIFTANSATYVSSGGYGGAVYNAAGDTATITRTIISGNSADIRGGGLYNYFGTTTITDSTFSSNSMSSPGDGGGGIYNDQGTLTITHSTFSGNTANSSGSNGGGIFNSLGTLNITRSTFSNNSVTNGAGGAIASNGTLTVANSTFIVNWADFGAGVYNGIGGVMTAANDTFSGNSTFFTTVVGGGIYNEGTLHLYNTILANTISGKDCHNSSGTGTVDGNNNLIETDDVSPNDCGTAALAGDPNLGVVTSLNPIYFPLNAGSPAINAGDDAKCAATPVNNTSQNGITRPLGAHCEIGSYEVPSAVLSSTRANADPSSASSVNFTVTFSDPVTGVDAGDFTLTTTGSISSAAVTGVTGSGATRTVTVNTGNGDGTIRLNVADNDSIMDAASNPLGGTGAGNGDFTSGEVYTINKTLSFTSTGAQDGWVLESTETSGVGGSLNATATTFQLGDDASNRQYRAILSFNTAGLPDNASIQSVLLKIKQSGAPIGTNPFNVLSKLWVDIRTGPFSANAALQLADFSAAATTAKVAYFNKTPSSGWYHTYAMSSTGMGKVNKTGLTQLRLYFALDDNNNLAANFMKFLSGNAASDKPVLVITYSVP